MNNGLSMKNRRNLSMSDGPGIIPPQPVGGLGGNPKISRSNSLAFLPDGAHAYKATVSGVEGKQGAWIGNSTEKKNELE